MEMWDAEYLDLVVPVLIECDREQLGACQFRTVRGWPVCWFSERDRLAVVECSLGGENDDD